MEFASEKSGGNGCNGVKEEKKTEHSAGGDDEGPQKLETIVEDLGLTTTSAKKEEVDDDELIESTKAEMKEVIEENKRLKVCLNKILSEYRALEIQFQDIVKQETKKDHADDKGKNDDNNHHQEITEESDLVSLSLGRVPRNDNNYEKVMKVSKPLKDDEGLTLGLECTSKKEAIPREEEEEEEEEEETGENLKRVRDTEDEVANQNPAKKARVCVRARCDTPTLNDGCQWRKYGQKISKGNPCPRAYYRCTIAPTCPVRKQVQRCAEDISILITTYEGIHNHTLPLSATAMASTTSAAASMLLSGSSSSTNSAASSLASTLPHSLNFQLSEYNKAKQIYITNPSLSSSPSHPTITLDLTSHPAPSCSSSSSPFFRFNNNNQPIRYPSSTSLSFGNSSSEPSAIMSSWSSSTNGLFLNHAQQARRNNYTNLLNSVSFGGRQQPNNIYQYSNNSNSITSIDPETISAATKALTTDPTFQSALAAALKTFIGGGGTAGENSSKKMKWGEMFPSTTSNAQTASSSLTLLPPSSTSKSASASPAHHGNSDNTN